MKNLFKILLAVTLFFSWANAIKKDEIQSVMNKKIDAALLVLKNKELSNGKKGEEIIKIIDDVFDYKLMARISLGKKTWKSISDEKKDEFVKLFEDKLKNSYIDKLELYTDQKVKIIELVPYKKSRLQLKSEVIGKDEVYKINYNFYKNKKANEWFIYDVDLIGVSIIQTYRKQFAGLLKEKTFDEMLEVLKEKETKN